jgi:threonylcarbamoyladenosine tRNA methylthiotransferase MtaB
MHTIRESCDYSQEELNNGEILLSGSTRIAIKTLGCKLNQYESMGIREALEHSGFQVVQAREFADIYIINTCTVTGKTDRRSRKATRHVLTLNPQAKIIVTGCGAQRDKRMWTKIPNVFAVIGNREKNNIVRYVHSISEGVTGLVEISDLRHAPFERLAIRRFGSYSRAFIKIQEGCDRHCSYCIIPSVRGRSRSQNPSTIVDDVTRLADQNYSEIVLTGIDLGTYGKDLIPECNLVELLNHLENIPGLERIRLSSIEPMEFNSDLIKKITASSKICRHFHIPLQSASNAILEKMNRSYTIEDYATIVRDIKHASPDACIGADVIAGFPGESEAQFEHAFSFIKSLPLDYLHVFSYSDRDGTPSSKFNNKLPSETIKMRCNLLRNLSNRKAEAFRKRFIGQTLRVVVLGVKDRATDLPQSLSDNYIRVSIKGSPPIKGNLVSIRLESVKGFQCIGKVVNQ